MITPDLQHCVILQFKCIGIIPIITCDTSLIHKYMFVFYLWDITDIISVTSCEVVSVIVGI